VDYWNLQITKENERHNKLAVINGNKYRLFEQISQIWNSFQTKYWLNKFLKSKVDKYLDDTDFMLDARKATKENKYSF
jgi:hypothetical protein